MEEFKPKTAEEIKSEVIEDLGGEEFDAAANADKVDKIVQRRLKDEEMKSSLHTQKTKTKAELDELKKPPVTNPAPPAGDDKKGEQVDIEARVKKAIEDDFLESSDYSDAVKEEIRSLAKVKGISVKKAVNDPYIAFKVQEEKQSKANDDATINRGNNKPASKDFKNAKPADFDLSTPEGVEGWKKYKIANGMV